MLDFRNFCQTPRCRRWSHTRFVSAKNPGNHSMQIVSHVASLTGFIDGLPTTVVSLLEFLTKFCNRHGTPSQKSTVLWVRVAKNDVQRQGNRSVSGPNKTNPNTCKVNLILSDSLQHSAGAGKMSGLATLVDEEHSFTGTSLTHRQNSTIFSLQARGATSTANVSHCAYPLGCQSHCQANR